MFILKNYFYSSYIPDFPPINPFNISNFKGKWGAFKFNPADDIADTNININTRMQSGFAIGTLLANQLEPILKMIEELLNAANLTEIVSDSKYIMGIDCITKDKQSFKKLRNCSRIAAMNMKFLKCWNFFRLNCYGL